MANIFEYLKIIFIIQLFYGFGITGLLYSLPPEFVPNINAFTQIARNVSDISAEMQLSTQEQINMPSTDLGSLALYSGNILLDLLLNSLFAVPEIFNLLIVIFLTFFNVDPVISNLTLNFMFVTISVIYIISMIQFLIAARTGRAGVI